MKISGRLIYSLIAAIAFSGLVYAQGNVLFIHVADADEKAVEGVILSNKGNGIKTDATDSAGVTQLALSGIPTTGDWIDLQVLAGTRGNEDWILISPWDGRVALPLISRQGQRSVSVVVAKKSARQLLADPQAQRAMAENASSALGPRMAGEKISEEQRQAALEEVARKFGFKLDDVVKAIHDLGEKSKDSYEQGLAALTAGNYSVASEHLSKSLEMREAELEKKKAELEKQKEEVFNSAFFLGQSLYRQGKYRESANAYQKALAQRSDDPMIMNNLALSLSDAGSYVEAEPLYKRALAINEKALGGEHPDVATSLNNLALLYQSQGKYAEAEPLYKHALAIREKALGGEHPDVATSLNNLALLYDSQGKYADAEPLYKRALAIDERALGGNHPGVATDLNNLAALYKSQGKYTEAEPLYKRALAINEKALGADHPYVAIVLENYADLLRKMNRESEAAAMETRAKEIRARQEQKNPKN